MNENAIDSYYQINCFTASPLKLIALCYDQAIATSRQRVTPTCTATLPPRANVSQR